MIVKTLLNKMIVNKNWHKLCATKHALHICHICHIPTFNILIEGRCTIKHVTQICHIGYIPGSNALVEGCCMTEHVVVEQEEVLMWQYVSVPMCFFDSTRMLDDGNWNTNFYLVHLVLNLLTYRCKERS
jgi:hypothetical protein